jgi:hypothetical protein
MPYKRSSPRRDTFLVTQFRQVLPLKGLFQQPRLFSPTMTTFWQDNGLGHRIQEVSKEASADEVIRGN